MPRMNPELARIRDRCFIDPETRCWLWRGAKSNGRNPAKQYPRVYGVDYTKDPSGKTKTVLTGARAVWHAKTQKPIPKGKIIYHAECLNNMCLNPAHLTCAPKKEWGESIADRQAWKWQTSRIRASRASGLKRASVTPEQIKIIEQSPEKTLKELCRELGLTKTVVWNIRTGKRAYATQTNPFAALLQLRGSTS